MAKCECNISLSHIEFNFDGFLFGNLESIAFGSIILHDLDAVMLVFLGSIELTMIMKQKSGS